MAGGLVFTGMPRRREVLGTGIIRWTKVVNPDGSVTWQEDQPTESVNSKKEEKGTKTDKQTLERPSWIDVKKESNVRVNKRLAHEVEDLEQKQAKVEARPTRAFSFRTEEKKTERAEKTTNVEEVRFDASVRDDKKKGFVAGLASKLDRTAEESVCPKKETKKEKVETQPAHPFNPPPKEEENANAEPLRSHWSKQEDDNKQESDAELAQRLANTEKIFRQQEQKIQAALDRIRDLEKQLASGFANSTSTESDEVQSKTTWDNESIAAGGRESGPHFRQSKSSDDEPMSRISAKGPLPCLSDHEPHNYRVLTVNSNKPEVCAGSYHEPKVGSTCELDGTRTPSPIAVTINIPPARQNPEPHTKPHHHHLQLPPIVRHTPQHISITQRLRTVNIPCPTSSAGAGAKPKPNNTPAAATKHKKPLPCLPTDARPSLACALTTTTTTPSGPGPSLCLRPRPVPRSVSSFKKQQRIERLLTPIPEEPSCSLKRRPRVPRMRRSRSSSVRRVSGVSVSGDCSVRPGSGRSGSHCSGAGAEGGGGGSGWKGEGLGLGGLRRGSIERVRTN